MARVRLPACVLAGIAFAVTAAAQGWHEPPAGKWWKNPAVVRQLELSPDQQDRIEKLWVQHRKDLIDRKAEFDKRQLELTELLSRSPVDESAALELFDRVQQARMAIEKTTFAMRVRIKNTLTREQQQRLEQASTRFRRGPHARR
jgi:Spy/CpxP family protein refolding chaperone